MENCDSNEIDEIEIPSLTTVLVLKKINPDKDYKLRFKEAVNNWKNNK